MATPSKPRNGNGIFGPRLSSWGHFPTPIREEPGTIERTRPSFIAETPSADRVAETPHVLSRFHDGPFEDEGEDQAVDGEDGSDDPLGELMVMTDEEDEPMSGSGLVPETPMR